MKVVVFKDLPTCEEGELTRNADKLGRSGVWLRSTEMVCFGTHREWLSGDLFFLIAISDSEIGSLILIRLLLLHAHLIRVHLWLYTGLNSRVLIRTVSYCSNFSPLIITLHSSTILVITSAFIPILVVAAMRTESFTVVSLVAGEIGGFTRKSEDRGVSRVGGNRLDLVLLWIGV